MSINQKNIFSTVSKHRLIGGLIVGLFTAGVLYSGLNMMREIIRVFSINLRHDILIFNDDEVHFINLFSAYLALIMGQAVCFIIWFDTHKTKLFTKNKYRNRIVNDQRSLNWFFAYWFMQMVLTIGGFFLYSAFGTIRIPLNLFDFDYIFILIILVLFFQNWNTLNLKFRRIGFKNMLLSFLTISVLAYAMSFINIVDSKKLNQKILEKNYFYKYKIKLPESSYYRKVQKDYLIKDIYLVKDIQTRENLIIIDDEIIPTQELTGRIQEWRSTKPDFIKPLLTCRFIIDIRFPIEKLNGVKESLKKANQYKIAYVIETESNKKEAYHQNINLVFPFLLTDSTSLITSKIKPENNIVVTYKNYRFMVNDSMVNENDLNNVFKESIRHNPNYTVVYHLQKEQAFGSYFTVVKLLKQSVNELRDSLSIKKFNKHFFNLDDEQQNLIKQTIPFRFQEKIVVNQESD